MANISDNTMNIHIRIDDDEDIIDVEMEHNISEDMAPEKAEFFMDLLNGVGFKIDAEAESIAFQGALLRKVGELQDIIEEYDADLVGFEPDDELLEKVKESQKSNVISLKGKLH